MIPIPGKSTHPREILRQVLGRHATEFVYTQGPGQYFDNEMGLIYNYARDYNSQIGQYMESAPTDLKAGISTYTVEDALRATNKHAPSVIKLGTLSLG